jgi:nucleoside-diphosphate-sugar epimerase
MKLMILGAGFSGKEIARQCAGAFASMAGTTRNEASFPGLKDAGLLPLLFDGETISAALAEQLAAATHLVQSIAPGEEGDRFLPLIPNLKVGMPHLKWVGYLSTIGVYGNHDGAWVDETAMPTPLSTRSRQRVLAENQWRQAAEAAGVTLAILRLAGIYGPGRNVFVNLSRGTARRLIKKDQVFNRIRVEDIGRATLYLLERGLGGTFNVTDDEPAPPQDVIEQAADLMGVQAPPAIPFETAELTPMARSFYSENKRVSNARLRATGFDFSYPQYRMSLADLRYEDRWRGREAEDSGAE